MSLQYTGTTDSPGSGLALPHDRLDGASVILELHRLDQHGSVRLRQGLSGLRARSIPEHCLVTATDHFTLVTEREHAAEVTAAIRRILEQVSDS